MNRKFFKNATIAALMIFVISIICTGCGESYNHLSTEEAMQMMKTERNYLIVDVRTREEYDKKHISNAVLVPVADIREGKLDALPDKNQILLIYCRTGRRAEDAATLLAKRGYSKVYEFGGIVNWEGEVEGYGDDDE